MSSFSDFFRDVPTTRDTLKIFVQWVPNPKITKYHFNRPVDVVGGATDFTLRGNKLYTATRLTDFGQTTLEPTEESYRLAERLSKINGLIIDTSSNELDITTYSIRVMKSLAVPDEEFDRDVVMALAEHFGVSTDDLDLEREDERHARVSHHWSYLDLDPDTSEENPGNKLPSELAFHDTDDELPPESDPADNDQDVEYSSTYSEKDVVRVTSPVQLGEDKVSNE